MCVLSLTCFVHIGFPSFVGFDGILFSFNSSFLISFSCFVTSSSSLQEISIRLKKSSDTIFCTRRLRFV
jgi:hypothetical protein